MYQQKYNRTLIGKNLGQFHSDFQSSKGEVLYGTKGIYLAKKVYAVELAVKTPTGEIVTDYHLRFKGINPDCLI